MQVERQIRRTGKEYGDWREGDKDTKGRKEGRKGVGVAALM
jgi:hypothetical protein